MKNKLATTPILDANRDVSQKEAKPLRHLVDFLKEKRNRTMIIKNISYRPIILFKRPMLLIIYLNIFLLD